MRGVLRVRWITSSMESVESQLEAELVLQPSTSAGAKTAPVKLPVKAVTGIVR